MRRFLDNNKEILRWIWKICWLTVAIYTVIMNVETRSHAKETYLEKSAAEASYETKTDCEKTFMRKDIHDEKEKKNDERWEYIKKTIDELKGRVK